MRGTLACLTALSLIIGGSAALAEPRTGSAIIPALQVAVLMPATTATSPMINVATISTPVSRAVGPDFFGLKIGMSADEVKLAYQKVSSTVGGYFDNSPIFGKVLVVQRLPVDYGDLIGNGVIVKRSLYFDQSILYRIRVEIASPDNQKYSAEAAIREYHDIRQKLNTRAAASSISEQAARGPFQCNGGSDTAKQLVYSYNSQNSWTSLSYEASVVLAIHCGVIPDWESDFPVGNGLVTTVGLYPNEGGGYYSDVVVTLSNSAVTQKVKNDIRNQNGG